MKISTDSKLYITKGAALFIGTIADTVFHKHHSIQITISLKKSFVMQIGNKTINTGSIIINSGIDHKLIGIDDIQALLLIDPESAYGCIFKNHIWNNKYLNIKINNHIKSYLENTNDKDFCIIEIIRQIAIVCGASTNNKKIINDIRINKIINLIETIDEKKVTIKNLASVISLSESRLQHLFKNHTGISIKKYLQWKRMIDGVNIIVSGKDFTFSSHEAGFSDSAHMSRTFKEMFGINLSDIFKNSRSVQVVICNK
jgi:AraC-like DNA-binding protein